MERNEAGQDADRVHGQAPAEGEEGDDQDTDDRRHSQVAAEGEDDDVNGGPTTTTPTGDDAKQ